MKLPEHAKQVFQGKIFEVYQWEQEMYDGTLETFEGLKRADTVQILPVMGDQVLLSYEEQPLKSRHFTFFGGQVEKGEDPLNAAKRELLEEAGLTSDTWELYKVYEVDGKIEWSVHFYIAKSCQKIGPQSLDSGEKIEIQSMSFDEFLVKVSDQNFWSTTIANDILRMRLDSVTLEQFQQKLFG